MHKGTLRYIEMVLQLCTVFAAVIHWYMGATARRMFEDEKPAILQQIDAECEKYAGQALPIPARGVKAR